MSEKQLLFKKNNFIIVYFFKIHELEYDQIKTIHFTYNNFVLYFKFIFY